MANLTGKEGILPERSESLHRGQRCRNTPARLFIFLMKSLSNRANNGKCSKSTTRAVCPQTLWIMGSCKVDFDAEAARPPGAPALRFAQDAGQHVIQRRDLSSVSGGLSSHEAAQRLRRDGPERTARRRPVCGLRAIIADTAREPTFPAIAGRGNALPAVRRGKSKASHCSPPCWSCIGITLYRRAKTGRAWRPARLLDQRVPARHPRRSRSASPVAMSSPGICCCAGRRATSASGRDPDRPATI